MAVDRQPVLKRCKALGISPMVLGYSKETNRHANANNRKKVSEYGMQLKEKQKLKFIYGVLEKQFYHYYEMAVKMDGVACKHAWPFRRMTQSVLAVSFLT